MVVFRPVCFESGGRDEERILLLVAVDRTKVACDGSGTNPSTFGTVVAAKTTNDAAATVFLLQPMMHFFRYDTIVFAIVAFLLSDFVSNLLDLELEWIR